jgi:hypothetical protein
MDAGAKSVKREDAAEFNDVREGFNLWVELWVELLE